MREELVERLAKAMHAALLQAEAGEGYVSDTYEAETTIDGAFSLPFIARACLASIEEAGMVVVPRDQGYHYENVRFENGVVVGPLDPSKPMIVPRRY